MDLDQLIAADGGIATRRRGVAVLGRHQFDNAVKSGRLVAVFPRVYAHPWDVDLPELRRCAALASVGGDVALSHQTSLELRGLPVPDSSLAHVTAYLPRHPRGIPGELCVHRSRRPLETVGLFGLPVVRTERALSTSWPLLSGPDRRAPVIAAARRR